MKKIFILASLLAAFIFHSKAHTRDSTFKKEVLKKTEIEVIYNHYRQNGNNSAVTGGIGTEKLTVYSPSIMYKKTMGNRIISFKGGTDIISSASTDNIDFVRSSASLVDARTYSNIQISQLFPAKRLTLGIGSGFSVESDYSSLPFSLAVAKYSKDKSRNFGLDLQCYFDDLRWGRLNPNFYSPQKLIYPQELRYQDWFTVKKRQSFNFKFSITQIINRRNIIGIFPEFSLQNGLLSTPFHRVYFRDSGEMVETLPGSRLKYGLGFKWNHFQGGKTILRNSIDLYSDNFGINSLALENETAIKINPQWTLTPFFRWYIQTASMYFAAYREHKQDEQFFTSDYDLSAFTTIKPGLGIRYTPMKALGSHLYWNDISIRYSYYHRSNNLNAHIISCIIALSHHKKKLK